MRHNDRDMSGTDRGSSRESDWSGDIGPGSPRHDTDDRMRNRESTDDLTDMDEDEEDLQERQREGDLGNERVRRSER